MKLIFTKNSDFLLVYLHYKPIFTFSHLHFAFIFGETLIKDKEDEIVFNPQNICSKDVQIRDNLLSAIYQNLNVGWMLLTINSHFWKKKIISFSHFETPV